MKRLCTITIVINFIMFMNLNPVQLMIVPCEKSVQDGVTTKDVDKTVVPNDVNKSAAVDKSVSTDNDKDLMKNQNLQFGDLILLKVWEYIQGMLSEIDVLTDRVTQFEEDLKLATHVLLESKIEPTRKIIKNSGMWDPILSSKLEEYISHQKSSIMKCLHDDKNVLFNSNIDSAMQSLDDFQIDITKEVSLCELMDGESMTKCYNEAFGHAEDYKLKFMMEELLEMERLAAEASEKVDTYWFSCASKAMSEVKKASETLAKELKSCLEDVKPNNCSNFNEIFDKALKVKSYMDMKVYYLELKRTED